MNQIQQAKATREDAIDRALRPTAFADFLGQEDAKQNLKVYVATAKERGEALDHILLAGPPGLGKTTLAHIIANEMGSKLHVVNAPSIKSKGELAGLLLSLKKGDILFLDEIHSLHPKVEEILYPALEDFKLEVVTGQGALAAAVSLNLQPFTLIGATTREGMLTRPLRDRFGDVIHMQLYTDDELSTIITRSATKLGLMPLENGTRLLARRARGTPRIANRLLRRIRDFAQYQDSDVLDAEIVSDTCNRLGIDSMGLDKTSQRYLRILTDKGMAMSLKNLTSLLGESEDTVEEVIEPHLLRLGFIEVTPKGRQATSTGFRHLHQEH
jgi:Holliday junction DNA helicase RuvB